MKDRLPDVAPVEDVITVVPAEARAVRGIRIAYHAKKSRMSPFPPPLFRPLILAAAASKPKISATKVTSANTNGREGKGVKLITILLTARVYFTLSEVGEQGPRKGS